MTETEANPTVPEALASKRRARVSWRGLSLSFVLLVAALLASDPEHVRRELAGVDLFWLLPAFAVACVQLMLLGLRWSRISRALGVELKFARATLEYALSVALNLVLPSGFAGDGFRAYRHHKLSPGPGALRIVEALALDRISGQIALLLVVLCGVPLGITHDIVQLRSLAVGLLALALLVACGTWVIQRVERFSGLATALARLFARAAHVLFAPRSLAWHLPLSLLFTAASVSQLYIAARALDVSLGLVELLWAGPLMLLAASLPSFFGGWGVREGAGGLLFFVLHLAPATGVAVSVVYGVFGLIVHLPGLLVLTLDGGSRAESARFGGGR